MPDPSRPPMLTLREDPAQRWLQIALAAPFGHVGESLQTASPGPAGQDSAVPSTGANRSAVPSTGANDHALSLDDLRRALADRVGPYDEIRLRLPDLPILAAALLECRTALVKCSHADTRLVLNIVTLQGVAAKAPQQQAPPAGDGAMSPSLVTAVHEIGLALKALRHLSRRRPRDRLRLAWQPFPGSGAKRRSFCVLGAGIAGVTVALELFRRGHPVQLCDGATTPLGASSDQPMLACHPQFARRRDLLSDLTQTALDWTMDSPYAALFERRGRFTPALDAAQAVEMRERAHHLGLPERLLRFLAPGQARTLADWPSSDGLPDWGGLWCSLGASLEVAALRSYLQQQAQASEGRLQLAMGARITRLEHDSGVWHLMREGLPPMQAEGLILAAGAALPGLLDALPGLSSLNGPSAPCGWDIIAGQTFRVSDLEPGRQAAAATIGGPLTLQRRAAGRAIVGSSYYEPDRAPDDFQQWQALAGKLALLPGLSPGQARVLDRHAGLRCYVRDRLPLIGPVSTPAGATGPLLYLVAGLGSRGLLWSHLAARLIADHLDGRLPALGLKALESLDPLRFASKPAAI